METSKAHSRRVKEDFLGKYCQGSGIDIGCGSDPLPNCEQWDKKDGDAHFMKGVSPDTYDFVYSSHCLEHLDKPDTAIINWFRITKPGGFFILFVPHRDLYEKRTTLPSRFNNDHKWFFLIDRDEYPCTIGVVPLIEKCIKGYRFIYVKECSEGWEPSAPEEHSVGEYSIEMVLQKIG